MKFLLLVILKWRFIWLVNQLLIKEKLTNKVENFITMFEEKINNYFTSTNWELIHDKTGNYVAKP